MYRIDAFVFPKFRRLGTGNAKQWKKLGYIIYVLFMQCFFKVSRLGTGNAKLQKSKQKYIIIYLKGSHSRPERWCQTFR